MRLSDYRGTPVVLNFWASCCHPCRQEFPLFRSQLAEHRGEFVVLGVDVKDITSDARGVRQGAAGHLADPRATRRTRSARPTAIAAVPQTFFIRRDGTIAQRYYAQIPDDDFATELAKITRSSPGTPGAG